MMRTIMLLHRWLGVAFAPLFLMWFATGIVMHFVPFPSLSESERMSGMRILDSAPKAIGPAAAVAASGVLDPMRVRLVARLDDPVYIVSGRSDARAVRAADGTAAAVRSPSVALSIATDYARNRGLDPAIAAVEALADYDQWTVPNSYDLHRPLFRVALGDPAGTEIYVSSPTGEVLLDTSRRERTWNWVGSVLHWIYPTLLRRHWGVWDGVVWTVSLIACMVAILGAVVGIVRIQVRRRLWSPYSGWQALHHLIGLVSLCFVLTWIFSGWLSMDHGRLFSRGEATSAEMSAVTGFVDWSLVRMVNAKQPPLPVREIEWFSSGGRIFQRDHASPDQQNLLDVLDNAAERERGVLSYDDIERIAVRLAPGCETLSLVTPDDDYPTRSALSPAPVYRIACGDLWFDIDGATGQMLQRLDPSRRAYRWLYTGLHTFNFASLAGPVRRSLVIVPLCILGLAFSLTGVVIGWRKLRAAATLRVR